LQAGVHFGVGEDFDWTEEGFVESQTQRCHGVDIDALGEPWLRSQKSAKLGFQSAGERFRECGEEDSGLGLGGSEVCGSVQGDHGFSCACGACDAGWAAVVVLDPLALAGVQENGPFFPALSRRWKLIPGFAGLIWRSKAVVFTAFCSSPFTRERLSVKESAMRNCI